ncbi:hypothetical protein BV25DRAFT_1829297 [Artomyces pyxidatus]|uniref:Uncharacterized protein n=1 Tax=Artomyces pyxidatus TaxID=48021 RepID=A0ACB8SSW9_9AGAM|nr:hypothetical protein BV25DRAFT_1829297 [Artomyces pyxidatus]
MPRYLLLVFHVMPTFSSRIPKSNSLPFSWNHQTIPVDLFNSRNTRPVPSCTGMSHACLVDRTRVSFLTLSSTRQRRSSKFCHGRNIWNTTCRQRDHLCRFTTELTSHSYPHRRRPLSSGIVDPQRFYGTLAIGIPYIMRTRSAASLLQARFAFSPWLTICIAVTAAFIPGESMSPLPIMGNSHPRILVGTTLVILTNTCPRDIATSPTCCDPRILVPRAIWGNTLSSQAPLPCSITAY